MMHQSYRFKYFCGDIELTHVWQANDRQFRGIGGTYTRHNRYGLIGVWYAPDGVTELAYLPITRTIRYKKRPSLHTCDARCRMAKGHDCECACGGKYHGHGR
jgi:hypothetical protein